jgi:hypothetical protein
MRRFLTLIAALLWLMPVGIASAEMTLQGYRAEKHDRFYVGEAPVKAFIGDPYNWSGVGRSSDSRWATMVSDSYFLSANHYHPDTGAKIEFYSTNSPGGSYETHTVASGVQIAGSDLWLGKLEEKVSANVAKCSILSLTQESRYDDLSLYTFGLSDKSTPTQRNMRLGRNNLDPGSIHSETLDGTTDSTTGQVYLFDYDNPPDGMGADESYLEVGDSGGPSLVTDFGGKPALVGIHWFNNEKKTVPWYSGDTFVPYYINAINTAMSSGEQLTLVPEPSTLALWSLFGMVGAGYGWWRNRRAADRC